MSTPKNPKIYHIVHLDRLRSIVCDGYLWCDASVSKRDISGTGIGMSGIKKRRLSKPLQSHTDLCVGDCVPFYFCPRSVMLFVIYRGNHPDLSYTEGQEAILHLVGDLRHATAWANDNNLRWACTLSNAGSSMFEDFCSLSQLEKINWNHVKAVDWRSPDVKESKQAEFLVESRFPWHLVECIGVYSEDVRNRVLEVLGKHSVQHRPCVKVKRSWYY